MYLQFLSEFDCFLSLSACFFNLMNKNYAVSFISEMAAGVLIVVIILLLAIELKAYSIGNPTYDFC